MDDLQPPEGAPPGRWMNAYDLSQYLSRNEVLALQRHPVVPLFWLPDARAELLTHPIHSKEV